LKFRQIIIIINNNNGLIAFPHYGYSMLQKVTCIHYDNIKLLQYYSILETYTLQEIIKRQKQNETMDTLRNNSMELDSVPKYRILEPF
jgi:hypothetical protein